MRLLFDQNLPPGLTHRIADLCPECAHVRELSLRDAPDEQTWEVAWRDGFTIVTKDDDFRYRALVLGHPPKVVHLRVGNCPVGLTERLLRVHWDKIQRLESDDRASLLMITRDATFLLIRSKP